MNDYDRAKNAQIRNDEDILRDLADRAKKHFKYRDKFVVCDVVRVSNDMTPTVKYKTIEHKLNSLAIISAFNGLLNVMNEDNKVTKVEAAKRKIRDMSFFK